MVTLSSLLCFILLNVFQITQDLNSFLYIAQKKIRFKIVIIINTGRYGI